MALVLCCSKAWNSWRNPKGFPILLLPFPTGLLPPSPCSQPPEVLGTQWSLSQGYAEGRSWRRLEKQGKERGCMQEGDATQRDGDAAM